MFNIRLNKLIVEMYGFELEEERKEGGREEGRGRKKLWRNEFS